MANSLEARSPFLDHKVIEFAASLPESLKMRRFRPNRCSKKLPSGSFREKSSIAARWALACRSEMVPRRNEVFVSDILLSDTALNRGIIRPEAFAAMFPSIPVANVTTSFSFGRC